MNSADVWHPENNPDGDMVPILEASIEEAKRRHPSAQPALPVSVTLTTADRCDGCGAEAAYSVGRGDQDMLFCRHHHLKNFPSMASQGWQVIGGNPTLLEELGEAT